ncbi:MAG: helix-turn-helix transcriptional regulator [Clostridium sp.]|uniref:helix-turn-helix domain-containing protein n=1 Tax=Clostridium sp. TaxID=1506 RepID=UPI0029069C6D|nr:helix-turn-helix transcriptional regulator [Clostridium sp.]MDU7338707.1 helix-turn-helix transcriptional regulator [Clostridium sp.]
MYKNKAPDGSNNLCGKQMKKLREQLSEKVSQKQFSDMLQIAGLDVDKNAIQRIESGERFVTDIELKVIAKVLGVNYEDLLDES